MTAGARQRLEREARVFSTALVGAPPTAYVVRHYVRGNESLALTPVAGFDAALVAIARRAPWLTRAADSYAGLFARRATLRRKLTLLLALLESVAPSDTAFAPHAGSPAATTCRLAATAAGALALALLAAFVLAPLQLASRLRVRG